MIDFIENSLLWQNPFLRGLIGGLFILAFDMAKSKDLRDADMGKFYIKNDKLLPNILLLKIFCYPIFLGLALLFLSKDLHVMSAVFFILLLVLACISFLPFGRK